MNFRTMTVRAKLTAGFGFLSFVVLVVSVMALVDLGNSNDEFSGFVNGINARAQMAENLRTAVDRRAIAARDLVLVTKPEDIAAVKAEAMAAEKDVEANLRSLNEMTANARNLPEKVHTLIDEINRVETQYRPVALGIVQLALDNKRDEAITKIDVECRPLLAALVTASNNYAAYTESRAKQVIELTETRYARARTLLIAISLSAIALAIFGAIVITRSLMNALGAEPLALSEVTHRVAQGNLSVVEGAKNAPAGSVLASMGEMQASLVSLISQVRSAADNIATGSSQIASGNIDLSSRTEEQASSLQQTAASMEELTSTVKQNADNAKQASALATTASDIAKKGNTVVGQVVTTMDDISQSSNKIADITGIIEGIAFQTNILALNAAVEAARAGEQGRGFAVVASEVRSLAQRSSSAAKEIKELIATSVQKIRDGSVLASDAGATMSEVTQAVARVTDIMQEIASASDEQSRGIEQVNQAVTQMDEVTQQNAALVEEATAASQSLENQGRHLIDSVSFFTIDSGGAAMAADAGRRSPGTFKSSSTPTPNKPRKLTDRPAAARAPRVLAKSGDSGSAAWETF